MPNKDCRLEKALKACVHVCVVMCVWVLVCVCVCVPGLYVYMPFKVLLHFRQCA